MFKVYIAGPITGKTIEEESANVERALDVADNLVSFGMAVYLPHISWFTDQCAERHGKKKLGYNYLKQDMEWILQCDAVFRMTGFSLGADKEVTFADKREIPVYYTLDVLKKASYDKKQEEIAVAKVDPCNFDERESIENPPGFKVSEVIEYPSGARESKLNHRFDLVPLEGLKAVAEVAAHGATKYGVDNWKKGIPTNSMLNHALRHVILFLSGDTTEDHLPHAAWRLLAAIDCLKMDSKTNKTGDT